MLLLFCIGLFEILFLFIEFILCLVKVNFDFTLFLFYVLNIKSARLTVYFRCAKHFAIKYSI